MVAIGAPDDTPGDLGLNRYPTVGLANKPVNSAALLRRINVIEVKNKHVSLATIDARISFEVLIDKLPEFATMHIGVPLRVRYVCGLVGRIVLASVLRDTDLAPAVATQRSEARAEWRSRAAA